MEIETDGKLKLIVLAMVSAHALIPPILSLRQQEFCQHRFAFDRKLRRSKSNILWSRDASCDDFETKESAHRESQLKEIT